MWSIYLRQHALGETLGETVHIWKVYGQRKRRHRWFSVAVPAQLEVRHWANPSRFVCFVKPVTSQMLINKPTKDTQNWDLHSWWVFWVSLKDVVNEMYPENATHCKLLWNVPETCVILQSRILRHLCCLLYILLLPNNCIIASQNMHPLFQIYRVAAALMVTKPAWLWKVVQLLRFTVKPSVKHNTLWAHSSADKEPKLFREGEQRCLFHLWEWVKERGLVRGEEGQENPFEWGVGEQGNRKEENSFEGF